MSSILLTNPFVTAITPPLSGPVETANMQVLAPAQGASGGSGAGNSTPYSGSGGRNGSGKGSHPSTFLRAAPPLGSHGRLSNATPNSIVNAQAQDNMVDLRLYGANLPEVEMPDPLPTSPFLLALREAR